VEVRATGRTAGRTSRPSISNVASLAGVSHQTVSRVLNKHPSVSALTRQRVLAAIDELGYRPNTAARALASGRSRTLGVVALDSGFYGPASTLLALQHAAQQLGYFVSVVAVHSIDNYSVHEAVRRLTGQSVEGLAIIAPFSSARDALAYLPTGTPVVAVEGDPETGTSVVTVDQVAGARAATEHLLRTGCCTVHHVAGPWEWLEARGRVAGWRKALEDAGADVVAPVPGDWSARSGYLAGEQLAKDRGVRGIFVANDQMALGVLRAMNEHGRRVPEDVAVVGFDDVPESEFFLPPLTTVRQDFQRVGEAAVRILVDQLDESAQQEHAGLDEHGARQHVNVVIDPELICRASTLPLGT